MNGAHGGFPGAGASHVNIAVYGGQYGVYFAESEPGPVVAGGTFLNQTVSGVCMPVARNSQGPLIVVGARVAQAKGATGPPIDGAGYIIDGQCYAECILTAPIGGLLIAPTGGLLTAPTGGLLTAKQVAV